jgi:hypothetical protein
MFGFIAQKRGCLKKAAFFYGYMREVVFLVIKKAIDLLLINGKRRSIKTYF